MNLLRWYIGMNDVCNNINTAFKLLKQTLWLFSVCSNISFNIHELPLEHSICNSISDVCSLTK